MVELKKLLNNSNNEKELRELIYISNLALKHWETYWTGFNSTYVCEEILKEFQNLNDFRFFIYGGYKSAQRSKIACYREDNLPEEEELIKNFPAKGIKISGNFLFDNATQDDFRSILIQNGVIEDKIGDIWTIGDRGAQGIIDNLDIENLNEKFFYLRDVKVKINIVGLNELQIPVGRSEKIINTVEASKRLDAIASAGFGIPRSKVASYLKKGKFRLNWNQINSPSRTLNIGDRIQFEGKGSIKILNFELTKRDRWKVDLLRE